MGKITNSNNVSIQKRNVYHSGHKIGKWWGRTLYYLNPKTDQLHYRTFSPLGIFLHLFGYKKKYNQNDLNVFLKTKNIVSKSEKTKQDEKNNLNNPTVEMIR